MAIKFQNGVHQWQAPLRVPRQAPSVSIKQCASNTHLQAATKTTALSTLFVLAVALLSACSGSGIDSVTPSSAATARETLPPQSDAVYLAPTMVFDGESVTFQTDSDASVTDIPLPNASAEFASDAGQITTDNSPVGMVATGDCSYSNTDIAAANGKWKFVLGPECSILHISDVKIVSDTAMTLVFDINSKDLVATQTRADIVAVDSQDSATVLVSKLVEIPATEQGWITQQLTVNFGELNQHVNKKLAVQFSNTSNNSNTSVDSISLKTFTEKPDEYLVFQESWNAQCNQQWAGENFWSNRLQDWQIINGRLQTTNPSQYQPNRTTHRISTEMLSSPSRFSLAVDTGSVGSAGIDSYSGFLIGAGSRMDYRSAALVHNRHGRNGGLIAGIDNNGNTFILDHGLVKQRIAQSPDNYESLPAEITLQLDGDYLSAGLYRLNLYAMDPKGQVISSTTVEVDPAKLIGNIAIVSNPGKADTAHWFDNWKGSGPKLHERPSKEFGPVLFSSYTVDRKALTVNAQYPPVCVDTWPASTLEVFVQNEWTQIASASIDPQSYTARFSINSWESTANTEYRIVTKSINGNPDLYFHGVIKYIPDEQTELTIGLYNCRPSITNSASEGWIQQNHTSPFTWTRDRIVFPHEELIENSAKHKPDLVAFLGDQIYEFDPNGLVETELPNITYDYFWKWFQFGWSVKELMRNTPSFVLPDDHDVFQGNVWGQGGGVAETEEDGGYVYPAEFINIVQRTQTGSLPSPFDATPVEQNISVYYTDMVMAGVGLAILEDRKFKTAPFSNQDNPQLLGERQEAFLEQWAADWEGQSLKIALSQSPFSQSTTHSGKNFDLISRDLDSNGWPKSGRDRAVHQLRKAFAPHLSGDQHLGLSLKHGVDEYDDAIYSFAAPSMLNIFPRIWDPLNDNDGYGNREVSPLGQYTDKHNNLLSVLAVANPEVYYQSSEPADTPKKDDLGIGYGVVRVNTADRQYTFEAWPADVDPLAPGAKPYSDWPITFEQTENDGRVPQGFLPSRIAAVAEPVVQVFNEANNTLEYARRYTTAVVELPVFDRLASYRVVLSNPETGYSEEFTNQRAQ